MGLDELNALPQGPAVEEFLRCCASRRWAQAMASSRPFADPAALLSRAKEAWRALSRADWLEAFSGHARIGEKKAVRENREQAGVRGAEAEVLAGLAAGNSEYERKFGHVFLVCATGKTAGEMLALLRGRLGNSPSAELANAAAEQEKITDIRLQKLLGLYRA